MSWSYVTDRVTYNVTGRLADMVTLDEAPWTCYGVTVTEDCAPGGSGMCDGYSAETSDVCSCYCHTTTDDLGSNVATVHAWHVKMWQAQPSDF